MLVFWLLVRWVMHQPDEPAADPVTFLIPEGFRGEVALVLQEECGQPLPHSFFGRPIITVPPSGLVITSDKLARNTLESADFYLVNQQGERLRSLLPLQTDAGSLPAQTLGVALGGETELPPPVPSVEPISYLSFKVTCLDSLQSRHQSPDLYEKLVLGYDVPPAGQVRLSRMPREWQGPW